jgi:predicted small secreted protein
MIKLGKAVTAAVAVSAMLVALSGCEKKEGPLEKAGKEVDNAAATAGQKIEKAGEKIQDAAKGDKK